jgi:6-phosphogluconolactonase
MKLLKNIGRTALVTGMSLAIAFGATACSRDYTVAYVYATSAANATIAAFAVDYQSGALTQITGSPFAVQSPDPISIIASPNGQYIYTLNSLGSNNITVFAVGTDGKLYGQQTVDLVGGSFPTAAAIDSTGSFMYVTFTLQSIYTTASRGKGGVDIFPINKTNGQLGAATVVPVGNNPVSVAVSQPYCSSNPINTANPTCNGSSSHYNVFVYVLDQEGSTVAPTAAPSVLGFSQNMSTGALTLLSGSSCTTTAGVNCTGTLAGVKPSAVVVDPTTRYVYVSDENTNQIYSYQIASNSTGNLSGLSSSPSIAGLFPISLTIDPTGQFLLSPNFNSNTISSYTINSANGSLGGAAGTGAASVDTGPTCVTVEPALGKYVYTSNLIGNSISGEVLNQNTGVLSAIANTPFPTSSQPSCIVAVANGSHPQSVINP